MSWVTGPPTTFPSITPGLTRTFRPDAQRSVSPATSDRSLTPPARRQRRSPSSHGGRSGFRAGKLVSAADGGEVAGRSSMNKPLPVFMMTNKVQVLVDGVCTVALVDTGAIVSVTSSAFKDSLGRKVMFKWDQAISFRGVGGETLRPLGVCTANVCTGGRTFKAEFAILARSTHDVILGIDFLWECGATADCAMGELSMSSLLFSALA